MIDSFKLIVEKLKQLRALRFKPKFDESENRKLDTEIDEIVSKLTNVSAFFI